MQLAVTLLCLEFAGTSIRICRLAPLDEDQGAAHAGDQWSWEVAGASAMALHELSNTLVGLMALGMACAVGGGIAFAMAWLSRET
jgi:hypothetical protein